MSKKQLYDKLSSCAEGDDIELSAEEASYLAELVFADFQKE